MLEFYDLDDACLVNVSRPRRPASRLRPRHITGEDGQALVEFALVLPVLLLLILGIVKGGIVYNNYLQLTDAVRSGARQISVERGQATPCSDAANQVLSSMGSLSTNQVKITITESPEATNDPAGAVYTWQNGAGSSNVSSPNNVSDCGFTLQSGSALSVQATYPCNFTFLVVKVPNCSLTASATERAE